MADAVPPAAPSAEQSVPESLAASGSPITSRAIPSLIASSPFRRHRIAFLVTAAIVTFGAAVTAFAVADDTPLPSARRIVEELQAPDMVAQLEALASRDDVFVSEQRIRRGDTLGALLTRLGVSDADAETFLRGSADARALRSLKPGRLVQARVEEDGTLQSLRYAHSQTEGLEAAGLATGHALVVERRGDGFAAHDEALANERRIELRAGEIRTSLFAATDDAGLPDGIATQIAEIFSGDIDFYRDLRRGDRFHVVYESFYQGGEFVRAGRILAIEFVNAGRSHSAMWYGGPNTANFASNVSVAGHYYGFDGRSLRRAFLRSPLEFTRISSGFGGRMHPIANVWRQHTGIDYAAPQGTPVRTTADGVVDFAGVKNGYGNVVIIHHQGVYSTLYGHLSQFASGLRRGQHIEQGSLIGYVGMTGWATGPHLHYEFRVSDHATNPLTAAVPEAPPIARTEWPSFHKVASSFDRQIELLRASEGLVAVVADAGAASVGTSRRVTAVPVALRTGG
jgi:murein DD-endopeptidase MepM/ murein hydrolase activator NlpD